jgi:hypothetical protein
MPSEDLEICGVSAADAAWLQQHILGGDGRCLIGRAGDGAGGEDAGGVWLRLDERNRLRAAAAQPVRDRSGRAR